MTPAEILAFERLTAEAWPTLEDQRLGGWLLRFATNYTGRANSVYPLGDPGLPVHEALDSCRQWFHSRGIRLGFKMTEASPPAGLDQVLAAKRLEILNPTQVMTLLVSTESACDPVGLHSEPDREWLGLYGQVNKVRPDLLEIAWKLLGRIGPEHVFARIEREGKIAACALGIHTPPVVWMFDVSVAEAHRRQGLGSELVRTLQAWAARCGAETVALQVVEANKPAVCLYKKFGFERAYRYWYRVEPIV